MVVYVVSRLIDYEGGEVIGVYSTQKKAEQAVDNAYEERKCDGYTHGAWGGIHYDWDEWKVEL